MLALRPPLSVALNDARLVALATAVALAEVVLRVAVALLVNPLLAIAVPPVVAAVGLAAGTPRTLPDAGRNADADALDAGQNAGAEAPNIRGVPDRLPRLSAVAMVGHAVALAGGVGLFVLVDTPAKAAVYWLGRGDALGIGWLVAWPTVGVAAGTFLAWSAVAGAVTATALGDPSGSLRSGATDATLRGAVATVGTAVARSLSAPRPLAVAALCHLVPVALALVAAATILVLAVPRSTNAVGIALMAAVAAGAVALIGLSLAFLTAFHAQRRTRENEGSDAAATGRDLPVRRVALALLVVSALVVGAGAVRVTETRPVDTAPEPLPEDPDALYATALANTERASHDYRVAVEGDDEPFVVGHRIDREDRRYRQYLRGEAVGPEVYASTGVGSPPPRTGVAAYALGSRTAPETEQSVAALPAYVYWSSTYEWRASRLTPPTAVEGWEVVERDEDRVVLELTDPAAVYRAVQGWSPDAVRNVSASRIRATVDPDRGTLRAVDVRLNATVVYGDDAQRYDATTSHEFAVDVNVERPVELGPPRPGEAVWRLLVY
ncbi:hypothetical protein [Haloparvum sedimenti]|uniref:hypothetical protein n=1 Tax=Haloparvum sedimenti TaxID=1678448 RepID=UPI00071E7733|nr:hypothetical protein [Haloparvum sedimenti]